MRPWQPTLHPPPSRVWPALALTLALWAGLFAFPGPGPAARAAQPPGAVYVVPVEGNIDQGLARFIVRAFAEAQRARASAIVVEITTLGGRVDSALDIVDAISGSTVPVTAYVRQRAWSAGALITIAAPTIAMAPGSSMGAAEPRPADEKVVSALRAQFEAVAERAGRDPRIAAAMVDAGLAVEGLVAEGELLTLTADRAREVGYADLLAASREEVLEFLGLAGAPVVEVRPTSAERVARFITDPMVAPLLLTLGFLGLLTEITTPGWGVPGTLGLVALALYFGGHVIAGFAGWEVLALFALGMVLLGIELFVPGFGVFGVGGLAALVASIVLASGSPERAVRSLSLALLASVVAVLVLMRLGRFRGWWRRLVLAEAVTGAGGYVAARHLEDLLGQRGTALTTLRPAGTVEIGGRRVDVVTEGEFIPAGSPVEVVGVETTRVVVRRAPEPRPGPEPATGEPARDF